MGFEKYDEAISKAQQEVNRIKQTAENLLSSFQQVMQTYLTEFSDYVVNQAVTDNPDVVTSLGEKRSELKKTIAEIVNTFPDECAKRIASVEWGHRANIQGGAEIDTFSVPRTLQVKTNSSIDGEIRQLAGKIGSLLIKYGLAKSGNEWQSNSGNIYYAYGLPDHNGTSKW